MEEPRRSVTGPVPVQYEVMTADPGFTFVHQLGAGEREAELCVCEKQIPVGRSVCLPAPTRWWSSGQPQQTLIPRR